MRKNSRNLSNLQFWRERSPNYLIHLVTKHENAPRPEEVETKVGATMLRVPFPKAGVVWWGFKEQREADVFVSLFSTEENPVKPFPK